MLDESDKTDEEPEKYTKEVLKEKLGAAKKRIEELTEMPEEIQQNGEISITDPDAKHMSVSNNGTDIAHNVQIAVESKHYLVVAVDVVSSPSDQNQLHNMTSKAVVALEIEKNNNNEDEINYEEKEILTVLADKGYYCGEVLQNVSKASSKNKMYKNPQVCVKCENKDKCTTSEKGRVIKRGPYQEIYDEVDNITLENKELYKQRQMIVEHSFGTVKRGLGFTCFLTRGNENVKSEYYMHFLTYNLIRVINIVGVKELTGILKAKIQAFFVFYPY